MLIVCHFPPLSCLRGASFRYCSGPDRAVPWSGVQRHPDWHRTDPHCPALPSVDTVTEGSAVSRRLAELRGYLRELTKHLFDWLLTGQVVAVNPAASVRGPRHVVTSGQTPMLARQTKTMKEERRLVWRVRRRWKEIAESGRLPLRDEVEPWLQGEDGAPS